MIIHFCELRMAVLVLAAIVLIAATAGWVHTNSSASEETVKDLVEFYLETIMERHLRYARVEAGDARLTGSRKEVLDRSWRAILRQVKDYVKYGTFRLGDRGRAQLCMLLIYRCANYLNLFMDEDEEKAIKEIYDRMKQGEF